MISGEPYYETVYHRNDWTLADAFRPQPGWGCRRFATPVSAFDQQPGVTDQALVDGAKGAAPEGYRLTRLSLCSDSTPARVIWSASADARFAAARAIPAATAEAGTPSGNGPSGE